MELLIAASEWEIEIDACERHFSDVLIDSGLNKVMLLRTGINDASLDSPFLDFSGCFFSEL
jgi:hypothetical protein